MRAIASTANYIGVTTNAIGTALNGARAISCSVWVSPGTSCDDIVSVIINGTSGGLSFRFGASGFPSIRAGGRSTTADSFQFIDATIVAALGVPTHILVVFNYSDGTITVYSNGAQAGRGAVTFGSATYATGTPSVQDGLGCNFGGATPNRSFVGDIGEVAFWDYDIGPSAARELAFGVHPQYLRTARPPAIYFPLTGTDSPERDFAAGLTATISGTVPAAPHPMIWFNDEEEWLTNALAGGSATGHYYRYLLNRRRVHA